MNRRRRLVNFILFVIVTVSIGASTALVLPAGYMIAAGLAWSHCVSWGGSPTEHNWHYDDVTITTRDGLYLPGWFIYAEGTPVGATVIAIPGHGASHDTILTDASVFVSNGYNVLAVAHRRCVDSSFPDTLGYREWADIADQVAYLQQREDAGHIAAFGFSAGGTTAIYAAAYEPGIEAVITMGQMYDLEYSILALDRRQPLTEQLVRRVARLFYRQMTGVRPRDISPATMLPSISPRPVYLIFGENEQWAARAQDQFALAGEPKHLWLVPGVGHGGYREANPEAFEQHVINFLDQALDITR